MDMRSTLSSCCHSGLWLICSGLQGSKGLGCAATGTWGEMSGYLHTSKRAPKRKIMQISLAHQDNALANKEAGSQLVSYLANKSFEPPRLLYSW